MKINESFSGHLMQHAHWILTSFGIGVITSGVLLGTLLGPIRSFTILFTTSYGQKWLAALIISILTLIRGVAVGYRETMKVVENKQLWTEAEAGNKVPLDDAFFTLASLESVEIISFIGLILLMISF